MTLVAGGRRTGTSPRSRRNFNSAWPSYSMRRNSSGNSPSSDTQKIEESYGQLMLWLDDIQSKMDEVTVETG